MFINSDIQRMIIEGSSFTDIEAQAKKKRHENVKRNSNVAGARGSDFA